MIELEEDTQISGKEQCLRVLEAMYWTRYADEKMQKLIRQNKGGTFHLSVSGHEMVGAVCALSLTPGKDWGLPYYRDRAFAIGIGCSLRDIIGACLARAVPHHSGGRMMPEHFTHKGLRIPCQSSCVGSQFLQAAGVAKAVQLAGKDEVVYVSAGDGATSQGDFHEAINFACLHSLGVIFVIQDNGWAISVPVRDQTAGGTIVKMAQGYEGLSVFDVDGCNYEELSKAVSAAVAKGRAKKGPSLIVAKVPRIGAHSSSDDPSKYKEKSCIEEEKTRDPIPRFETWLLDMGLITLEELEQMKERCSHQIEAASLEADQIPFPEKSTAAKGVFKDVDASQFTPFSEDDSPSAADSIVMMDALNHALDEEMKRDTQVVVFGQDVAHGKGGVFGITRHPDRKNTASSAASIRRSPNRASSVLRWGCRWPAANLSPKFNLPITCGLASISCSTSSPASTTARMANGIVPSSCACPMAAISKAVPTIHRALRPSWPTLLALKSSSPAMRPTRNASSRRRSATPIPSSSSSIKRFTASASFAPRKEPKETRAAAISSKAKIVRSGDDITVICWGMMVFMASQVADTLAKEGISVEVIDLRTIVPFDMPTVLQSVRKTGKALIAHEAPRTCGADCRTVGMSNGTMVQIDRFDEIPSLAKLAIRRPVRP